MGSTGVPIPSPAKVGAGETRPAAPQRTYTKYAKVCWKVATGQTTFLQEEIKERKAWENRMRQDRAGAQEEEHEGGAGFSDRPDLSASASSPEAVGLLRSPMRALLGSGAGWREALTPRRLVLEGDPPPSPEEEKEEEESPSSSPPRPPRWERLLPVLDMARRVGTVAFTGVSLALVSRSMARERSVGRVFLPVVSSKDLHRRMAHSAPARAGDQVAEESWGRGECQQSEVADEYSDYAASDLDYEDGLLITL